MNAKGGFASLLSRATGDLPGALFLGPRAAIDQDASLLDDIEVAAFESASCHMS
jgi:hypothetical protein